MYPVVKAVVKESGTYLFLTAIGGFVSRVVTPHLHFSENHSGCTVERRQKGQEWRQGICPGRRYSDMEGGLRMDP